MALFSLQVCVLVGRLAVVHYIGYFANLLQDCIQFTFGVSYSLLGHLPFLISITFFFDNSWANDRILQQCLILFRFFFQIFLDEHEMKMS